MRINVIESSCSDENFYRLIIKTSFSNIKCYCKYYFLLVEMLLLLLVKNGLILKEKERGNHCLKGRIRVRGGQELTIENTSAS